MIVSMKVDLVARAYCSRDCFDDLVPRKLFIIPDRWSYCKLLTFDSISDAIRTTWVRHLIASTQHGEAYLLPRLIGSMEMRSKHLFRHGFEASSGCLFDCRHWCETLHKTTVLRLGAICGILADFLDE